MPHSGKSLLGVLSAPCIGCTACGAARLRYTEINRAAIENTTDQGRPVVLSLWHDELFPLIYLKRRLNIIALVSQSDDGDLLAGVLERMGLETARGSSSRGGILHQRASGSFILHHGEHGGTGTGHHGAAHPGPPHQPALHFRQE